REELKVTENKVEETTRKVEETRAAPGTADEKRSAMEAALRALREAKETQESQQRLLAEQEGKARELDAQMRHTQGLMEQAKQDPSRMDAVMAELDRSAGR